ncbi:Pappalysin-2 [Saguinus oedipus]|uniref:Pappalysin-2 n=1 Tax=Saguinus oedipus TaxID=9490 RepID=A0ABQ9TJ88_SAGOE|nr:Pappalysin-2 [Saguinus oedipus]
MKELFQTKSPNKFNMYAHPYIDVSGIVVNPAYYGKPGHINTMIHEVGHVLGLYHVFKGVSEGESCNDPCKETVPSMETGDLCADTAPTPKSDLCREPEPTNDTCGFTGFPGAPFTNYMSYTVKRPSVETLPPCGLLNKQPSAQNNLSLGQPNFKVMTVL